MSTRTSSLLAGAVALALALSGCSNGDDEPSTSGSPSAASSAAAGAATYPSTDELRSALESAGVPCEEPESGTFPGASEAQSCIVNDAEDGVLLRFASEAEKDDYIANKEELSSAVIGGNWAIQTVLRPTAEQIQAAIGGELLLGPAS